MDAIECMKSRRSVRSYRPGDVAPEVLEDIVDCGRLAATAINIQPWHFVVVTDRERLRTIADMTDYGKFIASASACIAVLCEEGKYYLEDGSAATQNILNAARAHGLGSCWVAGDKKPYARDVARYLGAPEDVKLVSLVAIGHPDVIPEPEKKPLSQVLHWETF